LGRVDSLVYKFKYFAASARFLRGCIAADGWNQQRACALRTLAPVGVTAGLMRLDFAARFTGTSGVRQWLIASTSTRRFAVGQRQSCVDFVPEGGRKPRRNHLVAFFCARHYQFRALVSPIFTTSQNVDTMKLAASRQALIMRDRRSAIEHMIGVDAVADNPRRSRPLSVCRRTIQVRMLTSGPSGALLPRAR
jgi:hypothetical protein